jgi:RNA polymerase sigma factor (sigma-70 family)
MQMALDHDLVHSARDGDRRALETLLTAYRPDMRRIAGSQCASASDAEDAVQESLWLVCQRIGALRTIAAFPSWVFSIIKRECFRLYRATRGWIALPGPDDAIFAQQMHPDIRSDLIDAIQSLPDTYREAIVLRDVQELSVQEIAQKLQLTRAAVKSRIHRGRSMVREYLSE